MNCARFAANTCRRLPLPPRAGLACYRQLARLMAPSLEESVETLSGRRVFLITSTGRTGTTWLASLLNRVHDCHVVHEPLPVEQCAHFDALQDPDTAEDYLTTFRLRETAWRLLNDRSNVYGEVNGALRRHVGPLRALVPQIQVIHLIRNPRDVIISMLNRAALTASDRVYFRLDHPVGIGRVEWSRMDRFERLCWLWSADNAILREQSDGRAVFEDITRDPESFRAQILEPLSLELNDAVWREHVQVRQNATQRRETQHECWTPRQEEIFRRMVGPELENYSCYAGS